MTGLARVALDNLGQFSERGFFSVPSLLDVSVLRELTARTDDLVRTVSGTNTIHRGVRDSLNEVVFMTRLEVDEFIYHLHRFPPLVEFAEALIGKKVVPLNTEYFAKPPGGSRPTPPHQDQTFFQEHFPDELAVSIWVALDDVTLASGALQYVPRPLCDAELLPHIEYTGVELQRELAADVRPSEQAYETVTIPKGGASVHHAFTIHRSAPNVAGRLRRAVVFNYRGSTYRQQVFETCGTFSYEVSAPPDALAARLRLSEDCLVTLP